MVPVGATDGHHLLSARELDPERGVAGFARAVPGGALVEGIRSWNPRQVDGDAVLADDRVGKREAVLAHAGKVLREVHQRRLLLPGRQATARPGAVHGTDRAVRETRRPASAGRRGG